MITAYIITAAFLFYGLGVFPLYFIHNAAQRLNALRKNAAMYHYLQRVGAVKLKRNFNMTIAFFMIFDAAFIGLFFI